jgi:hypothetical protein
MEEIIGIFVLLYVISDVSDAQVTLTKYAPPTPCTWVSIVSALIPPDTQHLSLLNCKNIKPQEGALTHLYQLSKITIAHTGITEFPNITEVGSTLADITMYNNNISYVNPAYFIGFQVLTSVNLGTNWLLAHLPDIPQFSTVMHFLMPRCSYRAIPKLSHAGEVVTLAMDYGTVLTDFDKEDLRHYPKLEILGLNGHQLHALPDVRYVNATLGTLRTGSAMQMTLAPAWHTVALRTLGSLDLRNTVNLRILPTLCHENLAKLNIQILGSGLDFCDCSNAWMKEAAGGGATLDGMNINTTCGGLKWLDSTIAQLIAVCTIEPYGKY